MTTQVTDERTSGHNDPVKEKAVIEAPGMSRGRPPEFRLLKRSEQPKRTPTGLVPTKAAETVAVTWFVGAVALGIIAMIFNIKFWRIIKSQRPLTEGRVLDLFEDCKSQMRIQTIIGIIVTANVESPAFFGVIRPRLLLPSGLVESLRREELRYVFLHELAHHKRHDIYLGWLMVVLQVLHWFNPLVWLAFNRMRADRELACDALVLSNAGDGHEPQRYGQTIVNLFKGFSRMPYIPGIVGILENKTQLRRRIVAITEHREGSYRFSRLAALLLVVLGFLGLTNAREGVLIPATHENLVKVFGQSLQYHQGITEMDGVDDYMNVHNIHSKTIERIDAAMDASWAVSERISEMLESGEYSGLSEGDIQKARQEIYLAMYYEKASAEALLKSTAQLEEALNRLGLKIDQNPPMKEQRPNNQDKVRIDEALGGELAEKSYEKQKKF
jgi:beta-lactamase regulating signal transducer with metallopeptidase domain